MRLSKKDDPGQAAFERLDRAVREEGLLALADTGRRLRFLDGINALAGHSGLVLTEIRVICVGRDDGSYLCIAKADQNGSRMIAFSSGSTPTEALISMCGRLQGGAARWKEDKPWAGP